MSTQTQNNNKRIAKNTLLLYIRTLITLCVGLYTSRVVLNVLGVEDYGVYNVVGGVVAMFTIITNSLSQSISRYLTYELGRNDSSRLHKIFCTSINLQILMSGLLIIIAETLGVWFLNYKMNIPPDRMYAANWVLQFSVVAFIVSLISVPYNSAIIAHERMKAFAYVSVLEAVLKLVIAWGITVSPIDKLITYSFLLVIVSVAIRFVYGYYCKSHFDECRYSLVFDKQMMKSMLGFAGWSTAPSMAFVLNTQGINILCNLFFGVAINAARGVATQIEAITKGFVFNFTTAVRPQIIKSYSSGDKEYLFSLLCSSTKYSYYMMLVFALPFIFEADSILKIWLGNYPDYAPSFIRWTMFASLVSLVGEMLFTNILAVGKVRNYMIAETVVTICVFPATYVLFKCHFPPEIPYLLFALAYLCLVFVRLYFLRKDEGFPIRMFVTSVLIPVILTSIGSVILPVLVKYLVSGNSFLYTVFVCVICELGLVISVICVGINKNERSIALNKMKSVSQKLRHA